MKSNFYTINRLSDLDHFLPVAQLKFSNEKLNIYFIFIGLDASLKNLKNDPRLKIINKLKFKSKNLKLLNLFYKLDKLILKTLPKFIYSKMSYYLQKLFYLIIKIKFYFFLISFRPKKIFVDISFSYKFLKYLKRILNFNIISLPHGLHLHEGYIDENLDSVVFPVFKPSKIIDKIVLCNNNDKKILKIDGVKEINCLGSLRYSYYWINYLKDNFNLKPTNDNSKIQVIFFEDKNGQNHNGKFIPWVNLNLLNEVADYLSKIKNIEIIVCKHPSKKTKDFLKYNFRYSELEEMSFNLVYNADIVIGTIGTSILDAYLLNKKIISLSYCHYFKSIINKFEKDTVVDNFNDFKSMFNKVISEVNYNKNLNYINFYDHIIGNKKLSEKKYIDL